MNVLERVIERLIDDLESTEKLVGALRKKHQEEIQAADCIVKEQDKRIKKLEADAKKHQGISKESASKLAMDIATMLSTHSATLTFAEATAASNGFVDGRHLHIFADCIGPHLLACIERSLGNEPSTPWEYAIDPRMAGLKQKAITARELRDAKQKALKAEKELEAVKSKLAKAEKELKSAFESAHNPANEPDPNTHMAGNSDRQPVPQPTSPDQPSTGQDTVSVGSQSAALGNQGRGHRAQARPEAQNQLPPPTGTDGSNLQEQSERPAVGENPVTHLQPPADPDQAKAPPKRPARRKARAQTAASR